MPHKTPQPCGCCNPCFSCVNDNWYARCCRWYGYPIELAAYLSGTVLSFGPFGNFVQGGVGSGPHWATDAISIPGDYEVHDEKRISTYTVFASGDIAYEGTAMVKFKLSNVKIRLRMQSQGGLAPDCNRFIRYEVKWDQTFVAITSSNVRCYNPTTNATYGLVDNPAAITRFDNQGMQVSGYTYSVDWLIGSYPTTWLAERDMFGNLIFTYSDDCDFVHNRSEALVAQWPIQHFGFPTVLSSPYYIVSMPTFQPPGSSLGARRTAYLETPYWLGTGVNRTYHPPGSFASHISLNAERPPLEIQRSNVWTRCAVDPVPQNQQQLQVITNQQGIEL